MNIVTVSAEVAPWSKVGGLGDVMGALPIALAERGHRVMSVSPRYAEYPDAWDTRQYVDVTLFDQRHRVGFHHVKARGVDRVFLAHPCFLRDGIYGDAHGAYADNQFRYALLSRVAIEAARQLELDGSTYGEEVAFSVNDWHTALVPLFLDALYRPVGLFPRATTLLAIHNLAHQGVFGDHTFTGLDLPLRWASQLDMHGVLNTLKGGLVTADRLLTVSPSYAEEIQTPTHGFGLDGLLRARSDHLHGILNGIDTQAWDPSTDEHLAANYSPDDLTGKAACKAALQAELGLPVRDDVALLGFIGRLDAQKGVDLLEAAMPWIQRQPVQLVLLGSGSPRLEGLLRRLEHTHRDRVRGWVGFSVPMAHRILAGSDLLLMPSRFEPCGLNQMYAMRYGTPPVVHATGGLRDTVQPYDPSRETGTGWNFHSPNSSELVEALHHALTTWLHHPQAFRGIQLRGMQTDWSWDRAAQVYEDCYEASLSSRT